MKSVAVPDFQLHRTSEMKTSEDRKKEIERGTKFRTKHLSRIVITTKH